MTTIEWTVTDEMQLLGEQLAEEFAVESKLTRFPTGAAMLDVRANGRTFVMAYSPKDGFGVDEVQADEGLGTGYRHTFEELSNAAIKLTRLLRDVHAASSSLQPHLSLIVLQSCDIFVAKEFYNRLGLSFQEEQHGSGPRHFAATLGPLVFEIYPCQTNVPPVSLRVGFRVPSVVATIETLRECGTRIVSEPKDSPWGCRAVVIDPDGNKVELTQMSLE